jgi:hypothetical protein
MRPGRALPTIRNGALTAKTNEREARMKAYTATFAEANTASPAPLKLDAAVIGAGVAGLYQLHLLRSQG